MSITYSCDHCEYKTTWKSSLKRHIDSIHRNVTNSCDQCKYETKWKGQLKRHIRSTHGNELELNAHNATNVESIHGSVTYSCDQCEYKAKYKGQLNRHIRSIHRNEHELNAHNATKGITSSDHCCLCPAHIKNYHNSPGTSFCIGCKQGCCRKCKQIHYKNETMKKVINLGFVVKSFSENEHICNDCLKDKVNEQLQMEGRKKIK